MALSNRFVGNVFNICQVNLLARKRGLVKRNMCSSLQRDISSHKIRENFVTINNRKIKYVRTGCGPHAVLCCPGAVGSAWTDLKHQIIGLDRKKFTIVAWDPPGYGLSRPPAKDLRPGFFLRDANFAYDLMKALELPYFSVLAWSAGALTAFGLGATYPNNINRMVLWGALTHVTDKEARVLENLRDINLWPERSKAAYTELYGYDEFRTMWFEWTDTLLRMYRENEGGDVCLSELKKISCPLLVLHGNEDSIVSPDQSEYILQTVPGAEFYSFKNGKHNIHMQYHDEFNSVVMNFLLKSHCKDANRQILEEQLSQKEITVNNLNLCLS